MKRSLFIFRRDLRLEDNRGLLAALKSSKEVMTAFIFDPEQIEHNRYRGDRALQFMIESLEELEEAIREKGGRLALFYGKPEEVVKRCIEKWGVQGVFVNRDYTPFSRLRDGKIEQVCRELGASFHAEHDLLLNPPEETLKADGHPYTVFTPYHRNALKLEVKRPEPFVGGRLYSEKVDFSEESPLFNKILPVRQSQAPGGRMAALKILKGLERFSHYEEERDFPALDKTTHLSPHLKFNTCSVREVYRALVEHLGAESGLVRSLYWRDFFSSITFYFPHVLKGAFKKQYDQIVWKNDKESFRLWCEGRTGFPLVDAGMREFNETGFMHNRVRMVVASFLVKDLHIDWRWGERYFAQKLIDYDPAVNNGNWQWSASTGCDAQPYFRIFNPWSQSEKFDPEATYIKRWVPELASLSPKAIHTWYKEPSSFLAPKYPPPLVDHAVESKITLESYKQC